MTGEDDRIQTASNLSRLEYQHNFINRELEGECKIKQIKLLCFSKLKTILLIVPLMLSIVGLFIIKHKLHARVRAFYNQCQWSHATHVFIEGADQNQEGIMQLQLKNGQLFFMYKNLKYQLLRTHQYVPVAINYKKQLQRRIKTAFIKTGMTKQQVHKRKECYGLNEHIVEAPKYYTFMYETMLEPFFCIQYLAAVIYIVQKLTPLAILLLTASFITTSINYILLYISYRRIKEIAQIAQDVQVLRQGQFQICQSKQLIPGDLFRPKKNIYCDSILLEGEVYVDQSNLTGQSTPIAKFSLESVSQNNQIDSNKWLFEGSKVLSYHNALAIVIHTGYTTRRGRILRRIIHRVPKTSRFFKSCIYFLLINYIIGIIIYLGTLYIVINNNLLERILIFLNFLLILTFCISPTFPIYFNLVYSFSLLRLKWNDILGTQPQKTVQGAHLKIICFDKTGTLTQDKVQLHKVYTFGTDKQIDITGESNINIHNKIFGCCHSAQKFQNQLKGDQIDIKMFSHSQYNLVPNKYTDSFFEVRAQIHDQQSRLAVIKLNQYESKHQSMSVLVHDKQTNQYYIFVKGAPEIIHQKSNIRYPYFQHLLRNISYGGYRTIAYGYRLIQKQEVNDWLNQNRDFFLNDITILGLLVFKNKIKEDSISTIAQLKEAGIDSCIITGDNIFIAIQTAIVCNIINLTQEVIVIEGHEQNFKSDLLPDQQILNVKKCSFDQKKINIESIQLEYREYLAITQSIVIDNNFFTLTNNCNLTNNFNQFILSDQIKVFARTNPQNKASIIKSIQKKLLIKQQNPTFLQKLLFLQNDKVGMVGDGANDLMAIKQADIGIGIKNCDSSYASNFTVPKLQSIGYIIRQSKNSQRIVIEIIRLISIGGFLFIPLLIIMETEAVFFSSFQLIYINLTKSIMFPSFMVLSRPLDIQTTEKPSSNFLRRQNLFTFWGNVVIGSIGHLAVMIYYRSENEYIRNQTRATIDSGWYYETSLVTSQFLYLNIISISLVISLYQSVPWKKHIFKNYFLLTAITLNIIASTVMSFLVPQLKSIFSFVDMSTRAMYIVYFVGVLTAVMMILYNGCIMRANLYKDNPIIGNDNRRTDRVEQVN